MDALTLAAVADEIRATAVGGRVQDILQLDERSIGLEIYAGQRRHYLFASASPQAPRIYFASEKLRRGLDTPSPLVLLLRKYVDGSHLVAVEQPPFERILRLDFDTPQALVTLIIEAMERRANLILTEGDRVLDAAARVGPEINRYRTIRPGQPYVPPPAQEKADPSGLTLARLRSVLAAGPAQPIGRDLVGGVRGISPQLAREVVFRATESVDTLAYALAQPQRLLDVLQEIFSPLWDRDAADPKSASHRWEPGIVLEGDQVLAYAPYRLTHQVDPHPGRIWQPLNSISGAAERYYAASFVGQHPGLAVDPYRQARESVRKRIEEVKERVRRRRESLSREGIEESEVQALRQKGELILAYAATIQPGQTELRAAYEVDGPEMAIDLDPELSPVENAQAYFRQYEKARSAAAEIPRLLTEADTELSWLEQLETDLDLAQDRPAMDEVRDLLIEAGYGSGPKPARPKTGHTGPLRLRSPDGFPVLVGRNARQNEEVTAHASPHDLWLHARDIPGGHVVIQSGGQSVPDSTIQFAAELAAAYSRARNENAVDVLVTERNQVRPVRGGRPGLVTVRSGRTVRVKPRKMDGGQ